LTVQQGLLEVKRRTSAPERPFAVDLLLSSLAAAYGEGAIDIVLSGAEADAPSGSARSNMRAGLPSRSSLNRRASR